MMDFLTIATRTVNRGGAIEISPKFIIKKSSDLMIRGGDFYAIWVEERGLWSTDEQDVIMMIDRELDKHVEAHAHEYTTPYYVKYMWDASSGVIDIWHKYCQRQMRDNFHMLDEKLVFSNTEIKKTDYASKKLPYALKEGPYRAYDRLMSVLYAEEERHKIEWCIGAIVSGGSKTLQKFLVLYGAAGTGKSTVINIVQKLFAGYYSVFDAKAIGSANAAFALESFRTNPLVAIQHDSDLSRIEDNTRLNSLVSHEIMTVNEKFKSAYENQFKAFLIMGTNKPVKITDAKSGLLRRLIDVTPTGDKIPVKEYDDIVHQIDFELGAIAKRCLDIYLSDPKYYDHYIPSLMLGATNDFYNFVEDAYIVFKNEDGTTLKAAWERYKVYCEETKTLYPMPQRIFKEELKNYFKEYFDRYTCGNGSRIRSYYSGFKYEIFGFDNEENEENDLKMPEKDEKMLVLDQKTSILDDIFESCPAQYATDDGKPIKKWEKVKTTLKDLDTTKTHYVMPPKSHIVVDFDLRGPDGEKSQEENLKAAARWPETYAEFSKSGAGVHLHYIYSGDTSELSCVYDEHIEIKTFPGNSSLRRKLTFCNNKPIATINSGLPLKGVKNQVDLEGFKSEKSLRTLILRNLRKEIHPNTKPSIDFIDKLLNDAYASGKSYDVSDMRNAIINFAMRSTNNAEYCLKVTNNMKFKSKESLVIKDDSDDQIIFFDVEVFPNLFLVNYKVAGKGKPVVRLINPSPTEIESLIYHKLIGFNNRRYDNHMLYARLMGYNNEELYNLSQRIIVGQDRNAFFGEAYNLSYTDIYDFCSSKQSLKKWEIELGIYHKELGLPWDKPVPEEKWQEVAEYCDNDVIATEAVFNARQGDWAARKILAKLTGGLYNDTTNSLSGKLIFGNDRHPQSQFNYRFMGDPVPEEDRQVVILGRDGIARPLIGDPEFTVFDKEMKPHFPGYTFEMEVIGKTMSGAPKYAYVSRYRGEEVGEGGRVYAKPGIYLNVALLDVASMHPSSAIAEEIFGQFYTKRFEDIKNARVAVKHHDWDTARKILGGALAEFIDELDLGTADYTPEDLAQALKIVINAVYGLTSAKFDNLFKDPRNVDNIVAKRGALFMINLQHEVEEKGYTVAHIKTDSIKIPNASTEIIQFVMDYGELYGYTFEHEATYDRMCLVNDAVYIAKYKGGKHDGEWTATGTQFQVPYVFKTLFSKEDITFDDLCETKSASSALYLDFNENLPDVSNLEKELAKRRKGEDYENWDYPKETELGTIRSNRVLSSRTNDQLVDEIQKGHALHFVGKVGRFCPVLPGHNGGLLVRESKDSSGNVKYDSVGGTKGYRWLESSMVEEMEKQDFIDRSYYNALVDEAIATISQYGDFESFVAD